MSEEQHYAQGGYTGPRWDSITAYLHVEECVLAKRGETFVCVRSDHNHAEAAQ